MTDELTPEMLETMNATRILVAILKANGETLIPLDDFMVANNGDNELSVEYIEESKSFKFKLVDKN